MPEVVVRGPRGVWGRAFRRLFVASVFGPLLLMALTWVYFALEPHSPDRRAQDMRDLLEALLYTLFFWGGLLAAMVTGTLAFLTRGRSLVIEVPPPPA